MRTIHKERTYISYLNMPGEIFKTGKRRYILLYTCFIHSAIVGPGCLNEIKIQSRCTTCFLIPESIIAYAIQCVVRRHLGSRQAEIKACSFVKFGFCPNCSTIPLHYFLHNGQAHTCSFKFFL